MGTSGWEGQAALSVLTLWRAGACRNWPVSSSPYEGQDHPSGRLEWEGGLLAWEGPVSHGALPQVPLPPLPSLCIGSVMSVSTAPGETITGSDTIRPTRAHAAHGPVTHYLPEMIF